MATDDSQRTGLRTFVWLLTLGCWTVAALIGLAAAIPMMLARDTSGPDGLRVRHIPVLEPGLTHANGYQAAPGRINEPVSDGLVAFTVTAVTRDATAVTVRVHADNISSEIQRVVLDEQALVAHTGSRCGGSSSSAQQVLAPDYVFDFTLIFPCTITLDSHQLELRSRSVLPVTVTI